KRILVGSVAAALAAFLWTRESLAQQQPGSDSFGGTIKVFGCAVASGDLMVRARPIRGENTATLNLKAAEAGTTGTFTFRFESLETGVPDRLGVKILGPTKQRCPQFAWSVNRDPLVLAGDPPLEFRGYAVRSKIEVLATAEGRETSPGPPDVSGGTKIHIPKE